MALVRYHLQRAFCGFSKRFFEKSPCTTTDFLNSHHASPLSITQYRNSSNLAPTPSINDYQGIVDKFETVENPPEWKFVERLLPIVTVPRPPETGEFPSGWKPQNPELYKKLPYYVKRTKNHMVPVNLELSRRLDKKTTKVAYIFGDIWTLAEDIDNYLKKKHGRVFAVRVNEFASNITIRGDFALDTKEYLLSVGL